MSYAERGESVREHTVSPSAAIPAADADAVQVRILASESELDAVRSRVVANMAAGIAHDFNNIIAATMMYSQTLLRSTELSGADRERVEAIHDQTRQAAALIRQILDYSRASVLRRRAVDLRLLADDQVAAAGRLLPPRIALRFDAVGDDLFLQGDPERLAQALCNVLSNAIEASSAGGVVTVALRALRVAGDANPPIQGIAPGDWLALSVSDEGSGIMTDHVPHLFEPFFTTKAGAHGVGLGLAQTHGIVLQHGGLVAVETAVGRGTRVTMYLPALVRPVQLLAADGSDAVDGDQAASARILLVEDRRATREAMAEILELGGFQVLQANSGEQALALFQRQAGVDLVVTDLVMPGMGGAALYDELRARSPGLRVMVVTGYPLGDERRLLERGVVGWLKKPFEADELLDAVRDALAVQPGTADPEHQE